MRADSKRTYPLHIEASWEGDPGLPNLNPLELRRAEERRQAEQEARRASEDRTVRVRAFSLCVLFGQINRGAEGYTWTLAGTERPLGRARGEAFEAFVDLDTTLRSDLEKDARGAWEQRFADRRTRAQLLEQVQAFGGQLRKLYALAVADMLDRERHFLQEERAVTEALLKELGG